MVLQADLFGHLHIIVGSYPPLFTCMVAVKLLYLQQTCVFSLSIVLGMCSCNLSMEPSRTFLFSYLSFCIIATCHCQFQFDYHLRGEFSSYLQCASCTSNYCPREGSTFIGPSSRILSELQVCSTGSLLDCRLHSTHHRRMQHTDVH